MQKFPCGFLGNDQVLAYAYCFRAFNRRPDQRLTVLSDPAAMPEPGRVAGRLLGGKDFGREGWRCEGKNRENCGFWCRPDKTGLDYVAKTNCNTDHAFVNQNWGCSRTRREGKRQLWYTYSYSERTFFALLLLALKCFLLFNLRSVGSTSMLRAVICFSFLPLISLPCSLYL